MPAKSACGKLLSPYWHSGEVCEYQILRESVGSIPLSIAHVESHSGPDPSLYHVFRLARTCGTTDFLSRKPHSSSWAFLEIFIRNSGDAVLLTGAGKVDAAATRSWLIMRKMEFRRVRPAVDILIKTMENAARCCRFVAGKNPEKGGKVRKTRHANR
jgi:hypothetical protein